MVKINLMVRIRWYLGMIGSAFLLLSMLNHVAAAAPQPIDVGIYLNNIPAVNLKEKKFQVDFNIWFRWQDDKINPIESFKIFNGTIDSRDGLVKKKVGEINYAMQRVQGTIYRNFDVTRYPLDNHVLKIQIEDHNMNGGEVIFVADKTNSKVSPKITVPGWGIGEFESYDSVTSYKTNYGDISLAKDVEAKLPRFTFSVELKRVGVGHFFKYFSVLFLAALLTFLAFWLSPELIDTRYWLTTTAFFLAVITGMSLETNLPETDSFGLGDMLYNLTMVITLIATVVMIYEYKLHGINPKKAYKYTMTFGYGLPVVYFMLVGFIIYKA